MFVFFSCKKRNVFINIKIGVDVQVANKSEVVADSENELFTLRPKSNRKYVFKSRSLAERYGDSLLRAI